MTEPPGQIRRKNPLARTRQPVPLPAARSRAALGLAVGAAEGSFTLQVCAECEAVQYPPRDVCEACLSGRLRWRPVPNGGRVLAATTARVSGERYFRERTPWRTGLVRLDCGPRVVAHLHEGCAVDGRVRLELKLDQAGRGAVVARPEEGAHERDDRQLREMTADPRGRRALIVDGRASTAPALARALAEAGCPRVFVGLAECWKPLATRGALDTVPGLDIVPLDVTDASSVQELAGQMGGKVEILVNNAAHVRPGGILGSGDLGGGPD
ncbi:MAG: OB-fold domain-containing protein, partial [Methylobacteriaceae bacterium]|nr:OB-fold domain-containing protein [Methylobacteriaceae bacterium]